MANAYAYKQKNSDCAKLEKTCQSKQKTQSEDIKMFEKSQF